MDAIQFLRQQHLEIESLFEQLESASAPAGRTRVRLCWKLGDLLAAHAGVEETILFRATNRDRTRVLLDAMLEEHVCSRRDVTRLVELDEMDDRVEAIVATLRERKRRHAAEEESALFPLARELYASAWVEELGRKMERMSDELLAAARRARALRGRTTGSRPLRGT